MTTSIVTYDQRDYGDENDYRDPARFATVAALYFVMSEPKLRADADAPVGEPQGGIAMALPRPRATGETPNG